MSTPIYDDLCERIPAPDGIDEEESPAPVNEGDGATDYNGQVSGQGRGAGQNGHVERTPTGY